MSRTRVEQNAAGHASATDQRTSEISPQVPSLRDLVTGAEGGIRTPTGLLQLAPEASASAVPPLPRSEARVRCAQPIRLVRLPETPSLERSAMRIRLDNNWTTDSRETSSRVYGRSCNADKQREGLARHQNRNQNQNQNQNQNRN